MTLSVLIRNDGYAHFLSAHSILSVLSTTMIVENIQGGLIMEKYIFDEKNGLWYELQDDYYLPCLKLPEEEQQPVGIWGQRHLRYIKQNRRIFYTN